MTSKTFSTGIPLCPSPDIDRLSYWSLSGIEDPPLFPTPPAFDEAPLFPTSTPLALDKAPLFLGGLPFGPQPNNFCAHHQPYQQPQSSMKDTWADILPPPPHLTLRHFPRNWMRTKNSSSILGKAMSNQECLCQRKRESGGWRKRSKNCRTC